MQLGAGVTHAAFDGKGRAAECRDGGGEDKGVAGLHFRYFGDARFVIWGRYERYGRYGR